MSKLILEPVLVVMDRQKPVKFFWERRWVYAEKVTDRWRATGQWWMGEAEKTFFRVQSREGRLYEIYTDGKGWRLYRVYD